MEYRYITYKPPLLGLWTNWANYGAPPCRSAGFADDVVIFCDFAIGSSGVSGIY